MGGVIRSERMGAVLLPLKLGSLLLNLGGSSLRFLPGWTFSEPLLDAAGNRYKQKLPLCCRRQLQYLHQLPSKRFKLFQSLRCGGNLALLPDKHFTVPTFQTHTKISIH
jgi:hypothetical protein